MSDFGTGKWRKSRKQNQCLCCLGPIAKGEVYYHYKGMYDGFWQDWKAHRECSTALYSDDVPEFMPGDFPVPERVKNA